jgi:hypothetical protein
MEILKIQIPSDLGNALVVNLQVLGIALVVIGA